MSDDHQAERIRVQAQAIKAYQAETTKAPV